MFSPCIPRRPPCPKSHKKPLDTKRPDHVTSLPALLRFCLLYNTMSGKSASGGVAQDRNDDDFDSSLNGLGGNLGGMQPLTPCPSAVEYITPVFARNYQGVWRYVVQIPYEGYFTQTVEVTQCL